MRPTLRRRANKTYMVQLLSSMEAIQRHKIQIVIRALQFSISMGSLVAKIRKWKGALEAWAPSRPTLVAEIMDMECHSKA